MPLESMTMADTFAFCLSYIAKSSSETLESFKLSLTADEPINILRSGKEDGSVNMLDEYTLPIQPPFQLIGIMSSIFQNKQQQQEQEQEQDFTTTVTTPSQITKSKKSSSVRSSHSVETGESSQTNLSSSSIYQTTEFPNNEHTPGEATYDREDHPEGHETDSQEISRSQTKAASGHHGIENDTELDVLIRRDFRFSSNEVDVSEEDVIRYTIEDGQHYSHKGKQAIRSAMTDTRLSRTTVEQHSVEESLSNDKGKQPLRSALKHTMSPTRFMKRQWDNSSSNRTSLSEAKTIVQFEPENSDRDLADDKPKNEEEHEGDRSEDSESEEDQDFKDGKDPIFNMTQLRDMLDTILKTNPGSAISVRPYTNTVTGQEVFLFNHGIMIPRRDLRKLVYGVAIPGKIFRQKKNKNPYPSTSSLLIALANANLGNLDIGTVGSEIIQTLILEDAERAYRRAKYGDQTWTGINRERRDRYDPDTRPWTSIIYPSQWRRHGLVLPEGQYPPENSCKFRIATLCGKVLHQWYVRCNPRKAFDPREIIARIACGQDDHCGESLSWEPENGPFTHNGSDNRWIELDPDREGVDLPQLFYPFMKFWILEGPPKDQPPPGCIKINCVTRCGLVKSRIRLLCHRHISKDPKCFGGEFTMLIDRGCALRDDVDRCDERTICEGYLDWIDARLGLPLEELTSKQVKDLGTLHTMLVSAYRKETEHMGSFLKHRDSDKIWRDVIYNHIDLYEMLFLWGLRTIQYPDGLSVVHADESIVNQS